LTAGQGLRYTHRVAEFLERGSFLCTLCAFFFRSRIGYYLSCMIKRSFVDQMGTTLVPEFPPQRIISLVPSQTELLADLGLDDRVVGITKFCVHPHTWFTTKPHVGGTKNFDLEAIDRLQPDLIVGNKEENYREGIETLQQRYPVWMSDISDLADALAMIRDIGRLTDTSAKASRLAGDIEHAFSQLHRHDSQSVLYLIWRKPWMAAGTNTFIDSQMRHIGFHNCVAASRYPTLLPEEINDLKPDLIFLSSEPYPFREKHIGELQALCPLSKIVLVDGETFSWYGSRLLQAAAYFNTLAF
jgi:ABC-type Fe3+-hydroxamate transport system substrate-binding protein